ncbi:hypothetical protein SLA2020_242140 [Shorea laevis]
MIKGSIIVKIKGHNFRITVSKERWRADMSWWVKGQGINRIKGSYFESSFLEFSWESGECSSDDADISNEEGTEVEETLIEHNICRQRLNSGNDKKTYTEICAEGGTCGVLPREDEERSGQKKGVDNG